MRRSRGALLTAAVLVAVTLAGCGGGGGDGDKEGKPPLQGGGPAAGDGNIRIANFEFKPQKAVVKPGTTVTWINADSSIHDVKDTSSLATPPGPSMNKGDTYSITYAQPGSYSYICGIHPYMTGTVEVAP